MGVDTDYAEGVKWLKKAADGGDIQAIGNLGACYYNGLGVGRDTERGIALIRKAARGGSAEARAALVRLGL